MQKKVLAEKLREHSEKLSQLIAHLNTPENLTAREIENMLVEAEQLVRVLSAYKFTIEHKELSGDLNVHLKIMENINKKEEVSTIIENTSIPIDTKTPETVEPAVKAEEVKEPIIEKRVEPAIVIPVNTPKTEEVKQTPKKKIEFGINDKYRLINELFHQSAAEYSTALEQLNLTESLEDAETYLDNLKTLYGWKNEHPLVKLIYTLAQKRFQ